MPQECAMAAEIILFERSNCRGTHRHVFVEEADLLEGLDDFMEEKVASFVVVEGSWTFYSDINFSGQKSRPIGPGVYGALESIGMPNNAVFSLSSVRA